MTQVLLITSDGCEDCQHVKSLIAQASALAQEPVELIELDCESDEAVDKALLHGMHSVPSFIIEGIVFNTSEPDLQDLIRALRLKDV